MTCMCGDTECPSCGTAQGTYIPNIKESNMSLGVTKRDTRPVARHVFGYFEAVLGQAPNDATLKELPCDSNCGRDCIAAIAAAREFRSYVTAAFGDGCNEAAVVIDMCERVIGTYWHG